MEIIKLNLIPSGVNPTCHCSQYDNGRVIRIDLFDGLTPYVLQSGDTVTLNVRKPDNTIVTTSLTATQGNTYVNLVTTEQICACVGYNLCDLTITNGSTVIGTLNFIMQVERDVLADGIPSQSVIEDLDALVAEAVGDNYYTKAEVDADLALKADKSNTYTKTEVDTALSAKANSVDVYPKTQLYTKSEIDSDLSDIKNSIGTDSTSLEAAADAHWIDYPFRLYAGAKYTFTITVVSGTNYVRFYDKDNNQKLSKTLTANETFTYTFDTDIYKLQIYSAGGLTVSESHTGAYALAESALTRYPEYAIKDHTKHIITVGKDGTKDFTTITDALASITDSAIDNQYEVVVYAGVYNENDIVMPDYTHVCGIQANVVTVNSNGLDTTKSVFNMTHHSKLSNMRIISGTKYCVHVDTELNFGTVVCEGLYCEKLTYGNVIGIGCWKGGAVYIFKGCTFVNGPVGAHTNYNPSDEDNTRLVFDGCSFVSSYINLGLASGLGKNICEIIGMKTNVSAMSLLFFYNDYRNVDEPDTYFALPVNWNIIGNGNEYFTFTDNNTRHGLMIEANDFDKAISISGSAVDVLFGVTKVKGASSILKGAVYGSLRVDDAQAGDGSTARPYKDIFQMWKRLGDCSQTNKTLTVTVDGVSQTYTFDQDYTSSKPSETTLLAAINAVITNATISAYSPSFSEMINTTDKCYIKVNQSAGIKKGTWVTVGGSTAGANYQRPVLKGLALEDGVYGEFIPVWCGNAIGFTSLASGEYGIGAGGVLSADATTKIGVCYSNKLYLYAR